MVCEEKIRLVEEYHFASSAYFSVGAFGAKGPRSKPLAWKEKLDWSVEHLGDLIVTITLDKASVYGKFLYDDFPEYCYRWLKHRPRGLVIMPVEKFTNEHEHPQILQRDGTNFDQVKAALAACRNRQPHEAMVVPR